MRALGIWLSMAACGPSAPPTAAPAPVDKAPAAATIPGEELLFVSERGGKQEVYRQVPGGPASPVDGCPQLGFPGPPGPRGQGALLVCSDAEVDDRHGEQIVWTDLRGGRVPLSTRAAQVRNPTWAPDGSFVVYESSEASFRDLFRSDRQGAKTRLTDHRNGQFEPSISPDGKRLAFVSSRDENAEVYVSDIDGGHLTRLTQGPADDGHPLWSPDGALIAFLSGREGPMRVWLMKPDGSEPRPLIASGRDDHLDLAWSPASTTLAVVAQDGPGSSALLLVTRDGKELLRLAGGRNEHPSWHSGGQWLAFDSDRGGDVDIWVTRVDGAGLTNVTQSPKPDWLPRWQPAP